jgi:branched-subunit amino acid ABC-type transport system permease component
MAGWMIGALAFYFLMEWLRRFYEGHLAIILLVNTVLVCLYMFLIYKLERALLSQTAKRS